MQKLATLLFLAFFLAACSQSFTLSTITVSGPSTNALKIGETVQFSAVAKDSSGNTISGKTFTWVSSDSSIASVDLDGKVTAKQFGKVKITANVDGKSGDSLAQTIYGLQLVTGPYLDPRFTTVTTLAYVVRLRTPDGLSAPAGQIQVSGPTGFNGDKALQNSYGADLQTGYFLTSAAIAAVPGQYTATTVMNGETLMATYTLTADQIAAALPKPTNIILSNVSLSGLTANWSAVSGAVSYRVGIFDLAAAQDVGQGVSTTSTTATLSGLSLNTANTQYFVVVSALNMDWTPSQRDSVPLPSAFKVSSEAKRIIFP